MTFRSLKTAAPFIAMMPQWEFLDFLRDEAVKYPAFALALEQPVEGFVEQAGRIAGVRLADRRTIMAGRLVIAADGRSSLVRRRGLLAVTDLGAPMDVLWFSLAKQDNHGDTLRASVGRGRMVVLIDRRTYWQCGFLIAKGSGEAVKARGVGWIHGEVQKAFPDIHLPVDSLTRLEDLHLLEVKLDRLTRWHRPGLLAIGDAAHAMSPIGGIGINLAIQDAVAAANILAGPLASGAGVDPLLANVQRRRALPTRIIQAGQNIAQNAVIGRVLSATSAVRAPLAIRLLDRFPLLRRIPGRLIGLGVRRERVRSPIAASSRLPD